MGSKPKASKYKPSEADKASAAVAVAEYNFFKENYDPLLQQMRDKSQSDDPITTLRARSNADTMQALTGQGPSLQETQRIDAAPQMAQGLQGQLAQATTAGLGVQNQMQSNVLGVARKQGADAQTGMGQAARLGTSEALARAKADQTVSQAKFGTAARLGGTVLGAGYENIRGGGSFFSPLDPTTGQQKSTFASRLFNTGPDATG